MPREEKYVTVRLNDSLKRYDSVEIVILANGDTSLIVGKVWTGALPDPKAVPSFKLPEGEDRDLSIRVRGFDTTGNLVLNLLISKQDGAQVVADLPLPIPTPKDTGPVIIPPVVVPPKPSGLKELQISPGALVPAWDTSYTSYLIQLAYAESTLTLKATPLASEAVVHIGIDTLPNGAVSQEFSMKVGETTLSLISGIDGRESRYALLIKRDPPPKPDTGFTGDKSLYHAWRRRATVLVNLKTLGMNPTWTETDMPLLLRLNKDNFNFNEATYNGRDIRFATADGPSIAYEITRWEPENERAEIWIHSQVLKAADDSVKYYMYWGSPSAKTESDGRRVFIRPEGFTAAYHLSEQGYGTANEYKDAGGLYHGQAGDGSGRAVPQRVEGVVGYGQDFWPATAAKPSATTAIGLPETLDPGSQAWTFQTWVKRMGYEEMTIFNKGDAWVAGNQRFELFINGTNGGRLGVMREGSETYSNVFMPAQSYAHLGIVYTGTRYDIYVDGWLRESHDWTQGGASRGDCVLGSFYSDGTQGFQGSLDEVWIHSKARSPMWMRMTFENQKAGSTVVTLRR